MAQQKPLPAIFGRLHPRWNTPWFGVLFLSTLIIIPLVGLAGEKEIILPLLISAATFWLVAYIVAHIMVILLRRKYPSRHRPFKTPLYPWPQVMGILGMAYAIWNNSPSAAISGQVYSIALVMFIGISLYAFFWVRFSMKKGILETDRMEENPLDSTV